MKKIEELFCSFAEKMKPYSPIEPPDQVAKRLNLNEVDIIKLDANENPYGTPQIVLDALAKGKYYHIYPDPAQIQLRESIAKYVGLESENIVLGTGADELIDLLCRLFINPDDCVLGFVPTFTYYEHVITLNRGRYIKLNRNEDFSIDSDQAQKQNLDQVKMVMLCSPNNPSGNMLDESILDHFLKQNVVVIVDEAYFEFSGVSYVNQLKQNDNLVVLRTFSKCFALAGLRVGYAVTSSKISKMLLKIKPPFSVNVAAEIALKTCIKHFSYFEKQVNQIIETRDQTIASLQKFKELTVYPSKSNFILCKVDGIPAQKIKLDLELKGILIRYFDVDLLRNYIRISVGTPDQMESLIQELSGILS
ncbi:MAG: histidinol-phosphate transaminase [Deltaproteobacteria bacterium]|nr:histidinol-phosphate transaminase [Deltaproteobacteria bacterium]MBT4528111.1 histidinol-phosphate transaminase [Deltaproteobacteria bacterium]